MFRLFVDSNCTNDQQHASMISNVSGRSTWVADAEEVAASAALEACLLDGAELIAAKLKRSATTTTAIAMVLLACIAAFIQQHL
jgi:hypothetical protein